MLLTCRLLQGQQSAPYCTAWLVPKTLLALVQDERQSPQAEVKCNRAIHGSFKNIHPKAAVKLGSLISGIC